MTMPSGEMVWLWEDNSESESEEDEEEEEEAGREQAAVTKAWAEVAGVAEAQLLWTMTVGREAEEARAAANCEK